MGTRYFFEIIAMVCVLVGVILNNARLVGAGVLVGMVGERVT